jgi:hypothetical protein
MRLVGGDEPSQEAVDSQITPNVQLEVSVVVVQPEPLSLAPRPPRPNTAKRLSANISFALMTSGCSAGAVGQMPELEARVKRSVYVPATTEHGVMPSLPPSPPVEDAESPHATANNRLATTAELLRAICRSATRAIMLPDPDHTGPNLPALQRDCTRRRVGREVSLPTPHRSGRAEFPHPAPRVTGSLLGAAMIARPGRGAYEPRIGLRDGG